MSDLKKFYNLIEEYNEIIIPDFNEILIEYPSTKALDDLIYKEMIDEHKKLFLYVKFDEDELKNAAQILDMFYYFMEETIDKMIFNVMKKHKYNKCENLVKILNWKKNVVAIRRYITNNIVSEINETG
ncbi:hypothetical protein GLOIN_2v1786619 [Rhizophagus clarus]|uniref:Uncharacterized protein n=1 Tax=Rhizophagus clarus TaxID=94130 RepID=A0A8H3QWE5_9GLOM|nr:hypothetical protein GLOIN_2v1786619 [Rhizophagus clarus]